MGCVRLRRITSILAGSILLSIGINGFLVPYHLLDGGIIGISLILKYIWGFKVGLTIIFLSIPLYVIAWIYFRNYFYNSLHGLLFSSFLIDILSPLKNMVETPILQSAITGGVLVGAGIGIMLREDTSTGGTDLLAQFISKVTKLNVGMLIFIIDGIVLLIGSQTVGAQSFLYSIVAVTAVGITTTVLTSFKEMNVYV